MDLTREAVRPKPFDHRIGVEECPIDTFGRCAQNTVKPDGVCRNDYLVFRYGMVSPSKQIGCSVRANTRILGLAVAPRVACSAPRVLDMGMGSADYLPL